MPSGMMMLTCLVALADPVARNPDAPVDQGPDVIAARGVVDFDVRLPAEIRVDGAAVATLYGAGVLQLKLAPGPHEVMVLTNGIPRSLAIQVELDERGKVLVGRNGLTASAESLAPDDVGGDAAVELRVVGGQEVLVQIGRDRYRVDGRGTSTVDIPVGTHRMSVRNGDGTVIWASGRLDLKRAGDVLILLAEGRLPEVSGPGSAFHAGG